MARKSSYNYSLPLTHQVKVYIPLLGLEVPGRMFILLFFIIALIVVGSLTYLFSRFLDMWTSLMFSILIGAPVLTAFVLYNEDVKHEEGSNPFMTWYNKNIKHYREIITDTGERKQLSGRKGIEIVCIERSSKKWKKT